MGFLLDVQHLEVTFQTPFATIEAVRGIDFTLLEGETLAIVGESGCGKSATALAVMGLLAKEHSSRKGKILFDGLDLLSLSERSLRGLRGSRIGMVFQDPMTSLNPVIKIGKQITETIRRHKRVGRGEAQKRACKLLERVGISEPEKRFNQYPHEFSGGMCQRVMIALAIACEPLLLIADEPTTALDVTIQAQILELLQSLQEETGMSILLITHDLGVVAQIADRMAVMYAGEIIEQGQTPLLFADPNHPYTRGLLASVPRRMRGQGALTTIPGSPPDLAHRQIGCPFAPRCAYAMGICKKRKAAPYLVAEEHSATCWLHDPQANKQKLSFKEGL